MYQTNVKGEIHQRVSFLWGHFRAGPVCGWWRGWTWSGWWKNFIVIIIIIVVILIILIVIIIFSTFHFCEEEDNKVWPADKEYLWILHKPPYLPQSLWHGMEKGVWISQVGEFVLWGKWSVIISWGLVGWFGWSCQNDFEILEITSPRWGWILREVRPFPHWMWQIFFGHMTVQFASKIGVLHTEYYGRKPNSYVLEIDLNFHQGNGKTYSFSMLVKNAWSSNIQAAFLRTTSVISLACKADENGRYIKAFPSPPTLNYFQMLLKVLLIWELPRPANIQTFISKMAAPLIFTQTQL